MNVMSSIADELNALGTKVTFSTHKWHGKVIDRDASQTTARNAGAVENSAKVVKTLLAGADAQLKQVHAAIDAARACYYKWTLPLSFGGDEARGARFLPNTAFFDFMKEVSFHRHEIVKARDAFILAYPAAVARAKQNLGHLAKDEDYPDAADIARSFDFRLDIVPVPSGSRFCGLPDGVIQQLQEALDKKMQSAASDALRDAWERAREHIERMAEQLSKEKPKIYDTLVTNGRDLVELLKHFNLFKDPELEKMRGDLARLVEHEPDELRKDPQLRTAIAGEARDVLASVDEVLRRMVA
jgi:hypothetical protein